MANAAAKYKTVKSIIELAELCKSEEILNLQSWAAFNRIFRVTSSSSRMFIPKPFEAKLSRWFYVPGDSGPEEAVKRAQNQTVVRVFDRWTCNQTCFNAARACKPINDSTINNAVSRQDSVTDGPVEGCDFCQPLKFTAEDICGRLENSSGVTASNVAKYDAQHTMVVFKEHPPSHITKEKIFDLFDIATQWFEITNKNHPEFIYPIMSWNCRSRAGASQHHGHAHILLGQSFHYGHWERLHQISNLYTIENPGHNYFDDLIEAHQTFNLAHQVGSAWILIHLAPYCGYEFKVICWDFNDDFKFAIHEAVNALVNIFGSHCFNACFQFPPLENGKLRQSGMEENSTVKRQKLDGDKNLFKMPFIAHLVDRGDIKKGTSSDVCSMRIYGSAIVNEDPFVLAQKLKWIK